MSEKRRDWLFSIVLILISGAVFFSLGFVVAQRNGFVTKNVALDTTWMDDTTTTDTKPFEGLIDLNTATVEDLMQIEGIGEKTAQNIIDYRAKIGNYQYVEQLLYVDGIGETKYNRWSPYLTVGDVTTSTVASTTATVVSKTTAVTTVYNGKFNLNTVTKDELMSISGVGEKTAESILRYREQIGGFTNMEQLMEIDGIGEKRFATLCKHLTLDD